MDKAEILEFRQVRFIDACRVEQFPPAQQWAAGRPSRLAGQASRPRALLVLELVLDHSQRQVLIALGSEDEAEPLDVPGAELAVFGWRACWLDQALGLQEADLRHADVRELAL